MTIHLTIDVAKFVDLPYYHDLDQDVLRAVIAVVTQELAEQELVRADETGYLSDRYDAALVTLKEKEKES